MYNSEVKERFINQHTTSESVMKTCIGTFNSIEKYERQWGADICTRSLEEVTEVLEKIAPMRVSSKPTCISNLRRYARWCLEENIPGSNDNILKVKVTGVEGNRHKMVANPLMLEKKLHSLFDSGKPEYEIVNGIDNVYKTFCWFAFMGIPEEETVKIKKNEIDFDNMVVRHNSTNYRIYFESIPTLKSAVELDHLLFTHTNYTSDLQQRFDSDEVLRGFNAVFTSYSMREMLSRKIARYKSRTGGEIKFSYKRLYLSGIFYRKYQEEIAGDIVDFRREAEYHVSNSKDFKELTPEKIKNRVKQARIAYNNDYEMWKLAFGLA